MNSPINLTEIIIVNGTGVFCLLSLLMSKRANKTSKRVGEDLSNTIVLINLVALVLETISFWVDGKPGKLIYVLQVLSNAFLIFSVIFTGYMWCLFVEFKVYHSMKRVYKRARILMVPVLISLVCVGCDCFGTDLYFSISKDNVYIRGSMSLMVYLFVTFYYLYSIVIVYIAKYKGSQIHFFPVYTFVLPCIIGTLVQGMNYGTAMGWFSVAIALLLVEMQLQKEESFVDDLSGLYNRKYLEFSFQQIQLKKDYRIYGIMMDINFFKKINDTLGHSVGDDAIRTVGKLLSQWVDISDTVIRFAGDEFIILCINKTEEEVCSLMDTIRSNLLNYNKTGRKPYQLSFSMGYTKYLKTHRKLDDFLRDMDKVMYEDKEKFHQEYKKNYR